MTERNIDRFFLDIDSLTQVYFKKRCGYQPKKRIPESLYSERNKRVKK